jgi:hypothetical protein
METFVSKFILYVYQNAKSKLIKNPQNNIKCTQKKLFFAQSNPFCNVVSPEFKNFYDYIQLYKPKTWMVM